jgi:hypothetical protein
MLAPSNHSGVGREFLAIFLHSFSMPKARFELVSAGLSGGLVLFPVSELVLFRVLLLFPDSWTGTVPQYSAMAKAASFMEIP